MKPAGGDADLCAHAELAAIRELGRSVVQHNCAVDAGKEFLRLDAILSDDGLCVPRTIASDVIDSLIEAIDHIGRYGSQHTEAIITEDKAAAEKFLTRVDSAIVLHNASTQFADGGEFGMGAEIGIATGRFHARGPVGLEQLTTFKYVVHGSGQIRP